MMMQRHLGKAGMDDYRKNTERIRLLQDTRGTGRADSSVVFAEKLCDPARWRGVRGVLARARMSGLPTFPTCGGCAMKPRRGGRFPAKHQLRPRHPGQVPRTRPSWTLDDLGPGRAAVLQHWGSRVDAADRGHLVERPIRSRVPVQSGRHRDGDGLCWSPKSSGLVFDRVGQPVHRRQQFRTAATRHAGPPDRGWGQRVAAIR